MFQPDGYEKSEAVVKLRPFRDLGTSGVRLHVLSQALFLDVFWQRSPTQSWRNLEFFEKILEFIAKILEFL